MTTQKPTAASTAHADGPSFGKALMWMFVSLSVATLSVGGLFFKAFEM